MCCRKNTYLIGVYAAPACKTRSISSRPRCLTRGSPDGELIVTTSPDERVIVSYVEVSTGKLFAGICKAWCARLQYIAYSVDILGMHCWSNVSETGCKYLKSLGDGVDCML